MVVSAVRNRWHLDEMVVRIAGERLHLWRVVDYQGEVLISSSNADASSQAAVAQALEEAATATRHNIDKLASYGAAKREVMPSIEHRQHKGQPSRKLAPADAPTRQMKQFKSAGRAQRFLSTHDRINNLFDLRRDHVTADEHRASRTQKIPDLVRNL